MRQAGFTAAELGKRGEAEALSNELVKVESASIRLVQPVKDAGGGSAGEGAAADAARARQRVHDQNLMRQAGFTAAELGKRGEAEALSNELVKVESASIRLVQPVKDAGGGSAGEGAAADAARARQRVHDQNYHAVKARIMKPIAGF